MGPYPCTSRGRHFIVVVTDVFTCWAEAFAVPNVKAGTVIALLEHEFFPRYWYPAFLLTDNGVQFTGRHWRIYCAWWGVEHQTTPTYNPCANWTESRNQDIKAQLHIRLDEDHTKWDLHLSTLLYCLHRRMNVVMGHSPAELVQGHNLALPGEANALADTNTTTVDEIRDDARRRQELFLEVVARLSNATYLVHCADGCTTKVHRDDLRRTDSTDDDVLRNTVHTDDPKEESDLAGQEQTTPGGTKW
ncbi:uncharacterized protein LOC134542329 [Bacillus rossius redtenbacheri]|uniref:uncharacterized protein LOC134542329 n=1 Tax=Bacillus rossius redtenbacheri TaxID=93214 RepID=UPI002FDD18D3